MIKYDEQEGGMERENYVEIKGFYDLREYNIPDKIFIKLWRIQKYLKHVEDHKLYFKKLNVNLWEKAKVLSGEYQQVLASFA
jgi:hypothetical protein